MITKTIQNFSIVALALFGFAPCVAGGYEIRLSQAAGSTEDRRAINALSIMTLSEMVNDSVSYVDRINGQINNPELQGLVTSANTAAQIANQFSILAGNWMNEGSNELATVGLLLMAKYASNVVARAAEMCSHKRLAEMCSQGALPAIRSDRELEGIRSDRELEGIRSDIEAHPDFNRFLVNINYISSLSETLSSDLNANGSILIDIFSNAYDAARNAVGMENDSAQSYLEDRNVTGSEPRVDLILNEILGYIRGEVLNLRNAPNNALYQLNRYLVDGLARYISSR